MKQDRKTRRTDNTASLTEALQNLVTDMTRACTEQDAERGLEQINRLWAEFLAQERGSVTSDAARRQTEQLIVQVEAKLRQLKEQLARRQRVQEGEALEALARQREAEKPSHPQRIISASGRTRWNP